MILQRDVATWQSRFDEGLFFFAEIILESDQGFRFFIFPMDSGRVLAIKNNVYPTSTFLCDQ